MSTVQAALLSEYAKEIVERVAAQTIESLVNLKVTLSGDDSGLENTWEEICVQVQGEESYHWELYLDVMGDNVLAALEGLSPCDLSTIWLKTDEGWDWHWGLENDESETPSDVARDPESRVPYQLNDIVDYVIQQRLLSLAESFTNHNIGAYLGIEDEGEDEDGDELRERLIELMPLNTIVTDLWDWDIRFESEAFDDIIEAAFAADDEVEHYAASLAEDFLRWIKEYGMDYNEQDFEQGGLEDWIKDQCLAFMQVWGQNVKKEFNL